MFSSNTNLGGSFSPTFESTVAGSLSTLSFVLDLAVTGSESLIALSLIVTLPVTLSIVTPSSGALLNVHPLFVFVAVTFFGVLFGSLKVKSNVFTFSSFTGVTVTSPLFSGVTVGAVGFTWNSIVLYKNVLLIISLSLPGVVLLTFSTPFVPAYPSWK